MSWIYWVTGGTTALMLIYLLYALFNAEEIA